MGSGPFTIIASQELGESGPGQEHPATLDWKWYYHLPSLAVWGLIVFLLVALRSNRTPQAWLILLPLLAVNGIWIMAARLFSVPTEIAEHGGEFMIAMAGGWGAVWLLSHWLTLQRRVVRFFSAFTIVLAVAGLSYIGSFGYGDFETSALMMIAFGIFAVALLLGMTLSAFFCRGNYHPGLFMGWLLPWMVVLSLICFPIFAVVDAVTASSSLVEFVTTFSSSLIDTLIAGAFTACILYTLNLPFMLLAFRCPHYRDRLCRAFGVQRCQTGLDAR